MVSVRIDFRPDYADVLTNRETLRRVVASGAAKAGTWGMEFYGALGPAEDELAAHHARINAFHGSRNEEVLAKLGASIPFVSGIATNYVAEGTVRRVVDMGYEVFVISAACSAATGRAHQASVDAMSVLAEITTAKEAVARSAPSAPATTV